MLNLKDKKILITDGTGFIGSHVAENLIRKRGVSPKNIRIPLPEECDLRIYKNARRELKGIDVVFHLAADMGGVGYSSRHPAKQYYNCSVLDLQILEAAKDEKIGKVLMMSSACAYGHDTLVPLREDNLHYGLPAPTHDGFGLSKRMAVIAAGFYRREYNLNTVSVIINNTYGPRDNFDIEHGHVIPTLIRKCLNDKHIDIWGDGTPTRDFFYIEDAAEGIIMAMEKLETSDPVNLGSGREISIKKLVDIVIKETGYKGTLQYDPTKPRGQNARSLDLDRAKKHLGFHAEWTLEEGIKQTIKWYKGRNKTGGK